MAILVTCQGCKREFRAKDQASGMSVKCPGCRDSLLVQGPWVRNHEVFISYSHKDKAVADAVCAAMEQRQLRCWMAPRDILPGMEWGASIVSAIEEARVFILIFSSHSNMSQQVLREVERGVAKGVIILPLRIEDVGMNKNLEYFLSACHWLDAMSSPFDEHLRNLVTQTKLLLNSPSGQLNPSDMFLNGTGDTGTVVLPLTVSAGGEPPKVEKVRESGQSGCSPAQPATPPPVAAPIPQRRSKGALRTALATMRHRGALPLAASACVALAVVAGCWIIFHPLRHADKQVPHQGEHQARLDRPGPTDNEPVPNPQQASHGLNGPQQLKAPADASPKRQSDRNTHPAPAPPAPLEQRSRKIDLLRFADPAKDATRGQWRMEAGHLKAENASDLDFPYVPPEEYDYTVTFSRETGVGGIKLFCVADEHRFAWTVGGWRNNGCAFSVVGSTHLSNNPTTHWYRLPNGKQCSTTVKVRKSGVEAYIDGVLVSSLRTNYQNLRVPDDANGSSQNHQIAIGTGGATADIATAEIVEVTGEGKLMR